ncbi:MAG: glycosyltransferase family 2 protein [Planctomycetes bacterium]|nr:glycosyltransferase family 2 protein [Planctomycetota bacterium]
MLTDWIHWLSSLHADELLLFGLGLLLTDVPRYAVAKIFLCLMDCARGFWRWLRGRPRNPRFTYCPSVCAVVAGFNEEEMISHTLAGLWGSYPRLEIIVVSDGSIDDMSGVAQQFARTHSGVLVLSRPERGGKSSAMNFALRYTQAEVVVVIDADSELGPQAIWEVVQPLRDPRVGAVAGCVVARNSFTSLATWLQAYEYLSTIFVGRMVSAMFGILGIVSGAFGAFRRDALDKVQGWDVGPPEDLDLTLTLRKIGYRVAFAPYSHCLTEVPTTWKQLIRQRMRWEQSGVVRNHCRKHSDLADFRNANFSWSNLFLMVDACFFSLFCPLAILGWFIWFFIAGPDNGGWILLTLYLLYLVFEIIQVASLLYFSNNLRRDVPICMVFFLVPLYQMLLLVIRLVAIWGETVGRWSFLDNYVPAKVRKATWKW